MTRTSYEERGEKFARYLMRTIFKGCRTLSQYLDAVDSYNATHVNKLICKHGVSRVVIVRADYVIKIEYGTGKDWAGGNLAECKVYDQAVKDGMAHLLAKPTLVKIRRKTLSIMPRVEHIGDRKKNWRDHCTPAEREWLFWNTADLHRDNVGYKRNKVYVVDYAFPA